MEPVHKPKSPILAGIAIAAITVLYFALLGTSEYPEPGDNLTYDIKDYIELDHIDTRFEEHEPIVPSIESPRAMLAANEKIYVAGTNALVTLDSQGNELDRFEIAGEPSAITVAPEGDLILAMNDHIEVYGPNGDLLAKWDPYNVKSFITSVAADEDTVYVADAGNRFVLQYDREGNFETRIGEKDEKKDVPGIEVPSPYLDLALNDEGHLWVVNPGELGLERYRKGGEIVTAWYRPSFELDGFTGCCNPTQIAFAPDGKLITCEKGLVRVKVYDVTSGEFLELVVGSREFPKEQSVRDIAVAQDGRILILDPRSDTIRVFALKGESDGQAA